MRSGPTLFRPGVPDRPVVGPTDRSGGCGRRAAGAVVVSRMGWALAAEPDDLTGNASRCICQHRGRSSQWSDLVQVFGVVAVRVEVRSEQRPAVESGVALLGEGLE